MAFAAPAPGLGPIVPPPLPPFEAAAGTAAPVKDVVTLKEGSDPISQMKQWCEETAGMPLARIGRDLVMGSKFQTEENGATKIFAYRNPPSASTYFFVQEWTITVPSKTPNEPSKTRTFRQNIYTNITIPNTLNGREHKIKEYYAACAATFFTFACQEAIKGEAGQGGAFYHQIQDDINQISRERFLVVKMYSGDKTLKANPRPSLWERATDRRPKLGGLSDRQVTHLQVSVAGHKKTEALPAKPVHTFNVDIRTTKVTNQLGVGALAQDQPEQCIRDLIPTDFLLVAEDSSEPYVREVANAHRGDAVLALCEKDKTLGIPQALAQVGINEKTFTSYANGVNDHYKVRWEERALFFNEASEIVKMMGKGTLSKDLLDHLDAFSPKKKVKNPPPKMPLEALNLVADGIANTPALKDELIRVAKRYQVYLEHLKILNQEFKKNEKIILGIQVKNAQACDSIKAEQVRRDKLIQDITDIMDKLNLPKAPIGIAPAPLTAPLAPVPPPRPMTGVASVTGHPLPPPPPWSGDEDEDLAGFTTSTK